MTIVRNGIAAGLAAVLGLASPALAEDEPGKQMGTGGQAVPSEGSARTTTGTPSDASSTQGTGSSSADAASQGTGAGMTASKDVPDDLEEAIQNLHADNQAEIQMEQSVRTQAQSQQVKQYATKLADDHRKNDQKLTTLARTLGVSLQGEHFDAAQKDAREHTQDLQKKQGREFDEAYVEHMVKDHEESVEDLEKAAKKAREENHAQLASFLDETHTGMKAHLEEAKQLEKALDRQQAKSGQSSGTGSSAGSDSGSYGTPGSTSSGSTTGGASESSTGSSGGGAISNGGGTGGSSGDTSGGSSPGGKGYSM